MRAINSSHFQPLDGLRGLAILLVICVYSFHYRGSLTVGRALDNMAGAGWTGVTLFFVLSGFLITGILLDTRGKRNYFRDFFARRALRIFPLYFVFLAFYFFVAPHFAYLSNHLPQPPSNLKVYYWTYLSNVIGVLGGANSTSPPLDPVWSLAVEEQVYLVWPFLIALMPVRWLPATFLSFAALSFCWRLATRLSSQSIELSYYWTPANLEYFSAGALVAWLTRHHSFQFVRLWAPRIALTSGFFIAGMWTGQRHFSFWYGPAQILTIGVTALSALFAGLIGYSITGGEQLWLNRLLSRKWLRNFGRYSYAMYLVHGSFIALLSPIIVTKPIAASDGSKVLLARSLFLTLLVMITSLTTAIVSSRILEQPFLSLKRFFPLSGRVPLSD